MARGDNLLRSASQMLSPQAKANRKRIASNNRRRKSNGGSGG